MTIPISIIRKQVYDYRKKEYIDEVLATLTVKRGARTRGAGADLLVGSHIVGPGSTFRMSKLRIGAGSTEVFWIIRALGSPFPGEIRGTVDIGYIFDAGTQKWFSCAIQGLEF